MTLITDDSNEKQVSLDEVINKIKNLPMLPKVALEILKDLDDEDIGLDSIIDKVSLDPSLSAKVLKMANTSHYGANSKVVTIQQAVSMLGVNQLKNLIRLNIFKHNLPIAECRGFDHQAFWRHSMATAICAELISRTLHMKQDFAFTAGLLHDIGRLILVSRFPRKYEAVIDCVKTSDCTLLDAERSILGVDHVAVGLVLALHWNFAEAIQDGIRGHHEPNDKTLNSVAAIVHVANAIIHALDINDSENELVPLVNQHAWDTIALSEDAYLTIFRETELRVAAMNQILL